MINFNAYKYIGALTSKPYAFKARSWELQSIESIDIFDSLCSNIKADVKGSEIARILPINNKYINDEWLSDKSRYGYDGLKRWRFIHPMIKKNNVYIQTSWKASFDYIQEKITNIKYTNIIINTGNYTDLDSIVVLQKFTDNFNNVILNPGHRINSDIQNHYLQLDWKQLSPKILLFVGINIRVENPVLTIRLKKLSLQKNYLFAFIGTKFENSINSFHLGNSVAILTKILQGKHNFILMMKTFLKKNFKNINIKNFFKSSISVVFGKDYYKRISKNTNIFNQKFSPLNFNYNILFDSIGQINLAELGFFTNKPFNPLAANLYYLLGTDYVPDIKNDDLVIFQGHHNDKIRLNFNVILPTINWTEKASVYLNSLGFIQRTNIINTAPKLTRLDWRIIRMISIIYNIDIKYTNISEIHSRANQLSPNIINCINNFNINTKYKILYKVLFKRYSLLDTNPFIFQTPNYYLTNALERSSKVMLECYNILEKKKNNFI